MVGWNGRSVRGVRTGDPSPSADRDMHELAKETDYMIDINKTYRYEEQNCMGSPNHH